MFKNDHLLKLYHSFFQENGKLRHENEELKEHAVAAYVFDVINNNFLRKISFQWCE